MEFNFTAHKPPLSKSKLRLKKISQVGSPKSVSSRSDNHPLPPLSQTLSPKNGLHIEKLEEIYDKIQSFESPKSNSASHRYCSSLHTSTDFIIRSPFKTPSPKSSPRAEAIYTEWDIQQALKSPKTRDIRGKRLSLINSLKSM